ncbi:MAG: four helix bundle protein [Proteobacteria bacterium]|nr:four helix bundle protein [Pseudomonadota bacterium]
MARIETFEDLACWQKGRELTKAVYRTSRSGEFAKDFALRDQMRRACISITSNIAEGFERGGDKEFHQFLSQAKGSCGEVRSQLYVARDEAYLSDADFQTTKTLAVDTSRAIAGLMGYLNRSQLRGSKYRTADAQPT